MSPYLEYRKPSFYHQQIYFVELNVFVSKFVCRNIKKQTTTMYTKRLLNQLDSLNQTSVQITTNFAFNHKNIEMYRFIEII